jgi:hypothetical protein
MAPTTFWHPSMPPGPSPTVTTKSAVQNPENKTAVLMTLTFAS